LAPQLSPGAWVTLETALGRKLTAKERGAVSEAVGAARFWRARALLLASTQDIRVTLDVLTKLDPLAAQKAYAQCDTTTRAFLHDSLHALGSLRIDATGEEIKAAATQALAHFRSMRVGPRQTWRRNAAVSALRLWDQFGGKSCAPYAAGVYASPIVHFAAAIFEAGGDPRSASAIAKLLRSEAKRGK
jgi:hypothetical protein